MNNNVRFWLNSAFLDDYKEDLDRLIEQLNRPEVKPKVIEEEWQRFIYNHPLLCYFRREEIKVNLGDETSPIQIVPNLPNVDLSTMHICEDERLKEDRPDPDKGPLVIQARLSLFITPEPGERPLKVGRYHTPSTGAYAVVAWSNHDGGSYRIVIEGRNLDHVNELSAYLLGSCFPMQSKDRYTP